MCGIVGVLAFDKMSMGVSLEGRVPFLDHKFVELAMSIPEAVKTKNHSLKYILKKSVCGLIPDELINRKKQGFAVPISEWFLEQLEEKMRQEILSFCDESDVMVRSEVLHFLNQRRGAKIWYIFNFVMWWRTYIAI